MHQGDVTLLGTFALISFVVAASCNEHREQPTQERVSRQQTVHQGGSGPITQVGRTGFVQAQQLRSGLGREQDKQLLERTLVSRVLGR